MLGIIFALSLTLLIEPTICSLIRKFDFKIFLTSALANIVLNVSMNVILHYTKSNQYLLLTIMEIATVGIETVVIFLINRTRFGKTILFTGIANSASLTYGLLANNFLATENILIALTIINFSIFIFLLVIIFLYYWVGRKL